MSELSTMSYSSLESFRDSVENDFKLSRKELDTYNLSLDKDPSSKSPQQLYIKLYQAREYTNRSGIIYSKFLKVSILTKKLLSEKTEQRRIALSKIFKENLDAVSKLRSADEKTKYCEALLDENLEREFIAAKLLDEDAKGYLSYFKAQFDIYKEIKSDILTQLGIIKTMIDLRELTGSILNDPNEDSNQPQNFSEGIIGI